MSICWSVVSWPWLLKYYIALFMNHYTVDKVLGKQYYYYMYAIHLIEINFIPNCTVCFQSFFVLDFPFFQIILNILGLVHWWMADFKQVPDTVLYDRVQFYLNFNPAFHRASSGSAVRAFKLELGGLWVWFSPGAQNFLSFLVLDFFFQNILHAWTYRLYLIQLYCLQYSTNWKFNILPNIARLNFLYTTRCTVTLNVKQGLRTLQVQIRIGLKLDQRTVPTLPLYQLTTVC